MTLRPLLAALVALAACGGSAAPPTTADAGGPVVCPGSLDLTAAAPACNVLTTDVPAVPFTAATGVPFAPMGGVISDGTYFAARADGYGDVAPNGRRIKLIVSGGGTQWLWAGEVLDAAGMPMAPPFTFRANATASVSGTTVALTTTCSSTATSPLPASLGFTATQRFIELSLASASGTSVTNYVRGGSCP